MIQMQLSEAAAAMNAVIDGDDAGSCGVSTDSRTVKPSELFVALSGPNFDGHDWLAAAAAGGAAAAVVERPTQGELPSIQVKDTLRALGVLAAAWRSRFDMPVIGVTGSAGKTTVKEMIGSVLRGVGETLVTEGNLNNEIGVPKTLFRMNEYSRFAVVEMGASKRGDIAYLATMARPDFGIVTLCAPAHLEGFGDVETVAETKGEMFSNMSSTGTAVINIEDRYASLWHELAGERKKITFGRGGDVFAEDIVLGPEGSDFTLVTPHGRAKCGLPLGGRHNVNNALAAAAVCTAVGVKLERITAGLSTVNPVPGRLNFRNGIHGSRLIDDTYNANPASMKAALEVLAGNEGAKWFVLGDMGELGPEAPELHREVARQAEAAGVSRLFALGPLSRETADAFGDTSAHFDDAIELANSLERELELASLRPTILFKASRVMKLDQVVQRVLSSEVESC